MKNCYYASMFDRRTHKRFRAIYAHMPNNPEFTENLHQPWTLIYAGSFANQPSQPNLPEIWHQKRPGNLDMWVSSYQIHRIAFMM